MKKCRFCAEEIQDEAIKCRFCGEFLDNSYKSKPQTKWYHSTSAIIVGLLTLGPFALPLVWANQKYKPITKVIISIVVLVVTIWAGIELYKLTVQSMQDAIKQMHDLGMH